MNIAFCGYKLFNYIDGLEEAFLAVITEKAKDGPVTFFVDDYGLFDAFAIHCALTYKKTHPQSELIAVSVASEQKFDYMKSYYSKFDGILHLKQEGEESMREEKRNEWMVRLSDFVIAYVDDPHNEAGAMLQFADRIQKPYCNLACIRAPRD